MKILLLGNTGQVGWELERALQPLGSIIALDYPQINLADPINMREVIINIQPQIIINVGAYTDVDTAESKQKLAMAINGKGPGILAELAITLGAALIHYGTDYVFDGTKGLPYTEKDQPNPINIYGETKLSGEKIVQEVGGIYLIFRTSWVYSLRRPCFVTKILEWVKTQKVLRIVDDQVSSPTWARMLAEASAQVIAQGRSDPLGYLAEKSGLYHLAGGGYCSRYEWAKEILLLIGLNNIKLEKASSLDFKTKADRPLFTALDNSLFQNTFSLYINEWKAALKLAFD